MIIGVECTAHTFGAGVVSNGKVLSNVRDMYRPSSGGIIPTDAALHHKKIAQLIWDRALEESKVNEEDIKAIALSNGPGLAPCLYEGLNFVRKKAKDLNLKIIPVNHCIAHLEIGQTSGAKDPVLLYSSGANTQIIAFSCGKYRIFGETLDIGIGNFLDKVARFMGIPFPGGPEIEKLALNGNYIELPYTIKGMDMSFSGLQTKVQQLYSSKKYKKEDLAFSIQETVFAILVESAERALAHVDKDELVLGGGVACNKRFQEMCKTMCVQRGAKFYCPSNSLLVDNGAMIAYLGEVMFNNGISLESADVNISPRERTDEVLVCWR